MSLKHKIAALSSVIILASATQNTLAETNQVPTIVVKKNEKTGEYEVPDNFPGSATYISEQQIENKQSNDINRLIREVPGVNITEEDGYGLRPNIGLRGGRSERSADISLMEDGVLIAPAPYSSPSAYYFPSTGRVKGIEVRKGSSSIKFGPRTTSGAVNLITTPIPDFAKGTFTGSFGNFDEKNFNINYGDSQKNYGYVLNFDHQSADGFKELDGAKENGKSSDTGYELSDFLAKVRFNTDKTAEVPQAIEFKVGINDEVSNETYLGLTRADFNNNPYRRYVSSALDNMQAEHRQYEVRHNIKPHNNLNVNTTAYYHEFNRNWYKLQSVDDGTAGFTSLGGVLDETDSNSASLLAVLRGEDTTGNGRLKLRANNRKYVAQGIQTDAESEFKLGESKHSLEYGVRYHSDYEDRLQHEDTYSITGSQISLTSAGAAGSQGNRINNTRALSFFLEDEITLGKWTVVPGVRFEHIKLKREEYNSASNRDAAPVTTNASEDVIIPGIAVNYEVKRGLNVFGGIHKGFSPPSPAAANQQADAEESINYEAGFRYRKDKSFFEAVTYFNDYSNITGADTLSSSGNGTGDQFNGGDVHAYGLELIAAYDASARLFETAFKFPISTSYTYNHAEFESSFTASGLDEWGEVTAGDELPYVAKHQFALNLGAEFDKFSLNLSNKFVSAMRTSAGRGNIPSNEKIPSHFITDFAGFYEFKPDQSLFLAVDNLFDREYAVAARPAGFRPGKPQTARVGFKIDF